MGQGFLLLCSDRLPFFLPELPPTLNLMPSDHIIHYLSLYLSSLLFFSDLSPLLTVIHSSSNLVHQLMATPTFQFLQLKSLMSSLTPAVSQANPLRNAVTSAFKCIIRNLTHVTLQGCWLPSSLSWIPATVSQ